MSCPFSNPGTRAESPVSSPTQELGRKVSRPFSDPGVRRGRIIFTVLFNTTWNIRETKKQSLFGEKKYFIRKGVTNTYFLQSCPQKGGGPKNLLKRQKTNPKTHFCSISRRHVVFFTHSLIAICHNPIICLSAYYRMAGREGGGRGLQDRTGPGRVEGAGGVQGPLVQGVQGPPAQGTPAPPAPAPRRNCRCCP